jgi:hypothetical protein
MLTHNILVTQNLVHPFCSAYSSCRLLLVVVLVIALILIGTGSKLTVVIVDNSSLF